jgi:hypothetical protein
MAKALLSSTVLTVAHMEALQNLPSLTSIQPRGMEAACIPFLSSFPSLDYVVIALPTPSPHTISPHLMRDAVRVAYRENMLATFPQCHALTEITLRGDLLPPGDGVESDLLRTLPHLRELFIESAPWFRDLSCLTLVPQLYSLTLVQCSMPMSDSVRPLLELKQLRWLYLDQSLRLDRQILDLIRPPSYFFPLLHDFNYYHAQLEEEQAEL